MRESLKVAAIVLALSLLTICTILLLDISLSRLPNAEQRPDAHHASDHINQTTRKTIPTVDEFSGWNLEAKARYCAENMPEKSPIQWAQGYLCGAKYTDDETAVSSIRTVILTVVLFGVACVQAVIYGFQARTMNGQLIAAQQSAIAAIGVELPKLLLCHIDFADMGAANIRARLQYPKIEVVVRNYGRTPAFISQRTVEVECFEMSYPPVAYRQAYAIPPGTAIESRDTFKLGEARPLGFFTEEQIEGFLTSNARLAVYGYVDYRDFLGGRHVTRFYRELFIHRGGYSWTEGNPPKEYTESF